MKLHLIAAALLAIVATVTGAEDEPAEKKSDEPIKATFLIRGLH